MSRFYFFNSIARSPQVARAKPPDAFVGVRSPHTVDRRMPRGVARAQGERGYGERSLYPSQTVEFWQPGDCVQLTGTCQPCTQYSKAAEAYDQRLYATAASQTT